MGLPEHIIAKIASTGKFMWVAMIDYTSKAAIKCSPIIGIFSDYDDALKATKSYLESLPDNEFKETKVIIEAIEINKDYYQHCQYYNDEQVAL